MSKYKQDDANAYHGVMHDDIDISCVEFDLDMFSYENRLSLDEMDVLPCYVNSICRMMLCHGQVVQ